MGQKSYINRNKFPKQGDMLNKTVRVCFNMKSDLYLFGVIVRDDVTEPFLTIIKLDDGRHVLGTECQYREETA